jgi:hypothetical protein
VAATNEAGGIGSLGFVRHEHRRIQAGRLGREPVGSI